MKSCEPRQEGVDRLLYKPVPPREEGEAEVEAYVDDADVADVAVEADDDP